MNIAVVAASGQAGRAIIKEAKQRVFNVTAFVRKETQIEGADKVIVKDLFKLEKEDLTGFDAVVDAFGIWDEKELYKHTTSIEYLCRLLSGTQIRLIVVGGAGGLFVDATHTKRLLDTEDFPEDYKPVAKAMAESFKFLRIHKDLGWTYICPATDFEADGERTGKYILAGEELTFNSKGESKISYADYAIAVVDEIEKGRHIRKRISVLSE